MTFSCEGISPRGNAVGFLPRFSRLSQVFLTVLVIAMQIQYNITRIEEWCKSHDMPEGTLQLEHLMQATKLLQLKKVGHLVKVVDCVSSLKYLQATAEDIEIIYDVCWMLSPMQIQRMCTNYYVADYEVCLAHMTDCG